jgi:hypothetical protein
VTQDSQVDVRAMGARLADGARLALRSMEPGPAEPFRAGLTEVALELDPFPEPEELSARLSTAVAEGDLSRAVAIADATAVAQRLDERRLVRISAFVLGEVALVVLPGEVFLEHGLAVRAVSPFATTVVVAYDDNTLQYVPTREAFPEGAYEVDGGWRYIVPGEGERLAETAVGLLRRLAVA